LSIVDPVIQDLPWGSGKRHPGDVAYPWKKSTFVISFEGLNGKALELLAAEMPWRID
jgi:hypothetical protein